MKIEEVMKELKNDLKGLIKSDSDTKFIEQITALDKKADEISAAHKAAQEELQETKNKFVEYVKSYGFKQPGSGEEEPPANKSLDEIMSEELKQFEKEK